MKITRGTPQFTPVVITLESEEEVNLFRDISIGTCRIPAVLYGAAYRQAFEEGMRLVTYDPQSRAMYRLLQDLRNKLDA